MTLQEEAQKLVDEIRSTAAECAASIQEALQAMPLAPDEPTDLLDCETCKFQLKLADVIELLLVRLSK